MKLPGYYSSGEFAKKAHITKKTVRYYDEHNILKPSYVNETEPDSIMMTTLRVYSRYCSSNIWDFPWMISRR